MKKQRFLSIFLVVFLLAGLLAVPAAAAEEDAASFSYPTVAAKSALLVDGDTGQVLLDQDAHEKLYPASITKCMTVLLVLQAVDRGDISLDQTVTASQTAINLLTADSSSAGIKVGEQLTVEQLLYCVMVQSANEACYILAEVVSGSVDAFVDEMNAEAERLGCENTHFVNPCGLHDPEHYTTAWDVYLVTKEAMQYSMFMTLASTKTYTLPATNLSEERTFHTTNYLIDRWRATEYVYPYAKGIKTGHTSDAGYCLVSCAEKGGRSLISVVLGCEREPGTTGSDGFIYFDETIRLFDWGFNNFSRQVMLDDTKRDIPEVEVTLGKDTNYVTLEPQGEIEALLPKDVGPENFTYSVTRNAESVEAPVERGQQLGTITVSFNGQEYGTLPLVASIAVERDEWLYRLDRLEKFFGQLWVRILLVVIVVVILLLLVRHFLFGGRRRRYGRAYTGGRSRYTGRRRR